MTGDVHPVAPRSGSCPNLHKLKVFGAVFVGKIGYFMGSVRLL